MKINVSNFLYFSSYIMISIYWYMNRVEFLEDIFKYLKILGIILLLINCLIQSNKYSKITLVKMILLIVLGGIIYYVSKSDIILIFILMLLSIKNIDSNKLIKLDMITKVFILISLFLLSKFGMTNEYTVYRNGIQRYSYGFQHPNIFGYVVASAWIDFVYLYKHKINLFHIILIICSILFIDYYADSRSSGILLLMILIICMMKTSWLKCIFNSKIIKFVSINSWIIFTIISFALSYLYYIENDVGITLNEIFTKRFENIVNFYNQYNVNLFGNNLKFISTETSKILGLKSAILDNMYAHYILRYGLIFYCFICYYIRRFFKWAYNNENYVLIGIIFIFLIYSIIENRFNQFVFILLIGKMFYNKEDNNKQLVNKHFSRRK